MNLRILSRRLSAGALKTTRKLMLLKQANISRR